MTHVIYITGRGFVLVLPIIIIASSSTFYTPERDCGGTVGALGSRKAAIIIIVIGRNSFICITPPHHTEES